jgi:hypothetical protein
VVSINEPVPKTEVLEQPQFIGMVPLLPIIKEELHKRKKT